MIVGPSGEHMLGVYHGKGPTREGSSPCGVQQRVYLVGSLYGSLGRKQWQSLWDSLKVHRISPLTT